MKTSTLYPHESQNTAECHICGRATTRYSSDRYVFGRVCQRKDCQRISEGLEKKFKIRLMSVSLPVEGGDGIPSCWTLDGEPDVATG